MKPFQASSSAVEVNGETVLAILAGMGASSSRAHKILETHGIKDPKPGQWYSQQAWLDAFKEISDTLGPNTLFRIGTKIPEQAKFPPEIKSIEQALGALNVAYQMNHRGGAIGSYDFRLVDKSRGIMVCNNPYPSDFDRGLIKAMADRFKPQTVAVAVDLDESKPTRKSGGETCTYIVKW
jgi:hypothetical protein